MPRSALLGLLILGLATRVGAADFTLLPERSALSFISKQMGVPVDGRFRKFAAILNFDPAKPEGGKADITVDLASVDTGLAEADEEVVGKNWFNVKAFPTARFVSSGVKGLGGGRFEARGQLTIKGRSREVVAPFTMRDEGNTAVFDGGFALNRLDYAIGEGPWGDTGTVADEVQLKFHLVAAPARK